MFMLVFNIQYVGNQSDLHDKLYWTEIDIKTSNIGLKAMESNIILDVG
jgi:hypothetical protein